MACRPRPGAGEFREDTLHSPVQVGIDLVDEADPQRGRRVEALAGDEVAPRPAGADLCERER